MRQVIGFFSTILILCLCNISEAYISEYTFDTLPSEQEWVWNYNMYGETIETDVASVLDGVLTINTLNIGNRSGNYVLYNDFNINDTTITVSFRAKVISYQSIHEYDGLGIYANVDGIHYGASLGTSYLSLNSQNNNNIIPFTNNDAFHEYAFSITPGEIMYTLTIDDSYIYYGYGETSNKPDYIGIGDSSSSGNVHTEFTSVGIYQTPIPGAVWLLGSGLLGIVGLRKKLKIASQISEN